jgi:hypothetical protein
MCERKYILKEKYQKMKAINEKAISEVCEMLRRENEM